MTSRKRLEQGEMKGWATGGGAHFCPQVPPIPHINATLSSQQPCLYHLLVETTPSGGDLSPAGLRHPRQSAATRVQMYRYAHGPDPQGEGGVLLSTHTRAHAHVHTHAPCNSPMFPGMRLANPQLQHPWSQLTPFLFSSGHCSSSLR